MRKTKAIISLSFLLLGISFPCFASSLPDAEITTKIGLGTGPSISADFRVSPKFSIGGSFGAPFYRGWFNSGLYDVRALYKFLDQGKFAFSGVLGVTGNTAFNTIFPGSPFGGEIGVALSYQFLPQLTGKLNIVGGIPFGGGPGIWWGFVSPASGVELGYKFNNTVELSLGGNGQGDFLGLNLYF
jgi:hypothetical protein